MLSSVCDKVYDLLTVIEEIGHSDAELQINTSTDWLTDIKADFERTFLNFILNVLNFTNKK